MPPLTLRHHDIKLKVTADDDATLKVYVVVDSTEADAVDLGNGNFGKLISSDKVVNGDVVTYDASAYDDQETQLQFITVATDEAGNTNTSPVYTM
ncbi:Ig-like domain-containing protein, partial [Aduncisulcus paluster]